MTDPFPAEDGLFATAESWHPAEDRVADAGALGPWLVLRGSLTAALRRACSHDLHLRVHRRFWRSVPEPAAEGLAIAPATQILQREVWLLCDDMPLVFARSWIPAGTLPDPGETPLGDRLFEADSGVERLSLEAAPIVADSGATRWARRAVHATPGGRLLVGEVFLPGMESL